MDERLESTWHLVYYQVSGEPGIACYGRRSDIYLVECGLAHKLIHWSSPRNFIFRVFNFRGLSQLRNYFNSVIFPIYGMFIFVGDSKQVWTGSFCLELGCFQISLLWRVSKDEGKGSCSGCLLYTSPIGQRYMGSCRSQVRRSLSTDVLSMFSRVLLNLSSHWGW